MKPIDPEDPAAKSQDIAKANVERLRSVFPEAVAEGRVDFEALRQQFGSAVAEQEEKYGLLWHGKSRARGQALNPCLGTLLPRPEESVSWDSTRNLVIEGDNLEVLKLLQHSYAGKVKLIYIDPPYNTGKDFIYPDNFKDSVAGYLKITGQTDGNGGKLTTNPETSGRFHTDWLNMMYPRLKLARNLLRNDGIFIASISDAEVHTLRCMTDEIFGDDNLVGCVVWNSTKSVTNTALLSVSHTHNLIYARNRDYFVKNRTHFRLLDNGDGFSNPDDDPRGPWKADPFQVGGERPNQMYPITNPNTGDVFKPKPGNSWKNEKRVFEKLMSEGRIVFGVKGEGGPQRKRYRSEAVERGRVAKTWWDDVGTTTDATRETKKLMGEAVFTSPKPVSLIRKFIQLGTYDPQDSIVLDFFAGSGTAAQAVVEQNAQDGGSRRYILVQLPEPLSLADKEQKFAAEYCGSMGKPLNLAELTKERLRRAGQKIREDQPDFAGDTGFRVFRLDRSNIKQWDPSTDDLEQALFDHVDNVRESRSEADIFHELLLKYGFDLCAATEKLEIAGRDAVATSDGALVAFLVPEICESDTEKVALDIAAWVEQRTKSDDACVVFRDNAFPSDVAKANVTEILAQRGIKEVRSL